MLEKEAFESVIAFSFLFNVITRVLNDNGLLLLDKNHFINVVLGKMGE